MDCNTFLWRKKLVNLNMKGLWIGEFNPNECSQKLVLCGSEKSERRIQENQSKAWAKRKLSIKQKNQVKYQIKSSIFYFFSTGGREEGKKAAQRCLTKPLWWVARWPSDLTVGEQGLDSRPRTLTMLGR